MSDIMFRYLEKYIGTYRVKAEFDYKKNDFPRNENGGVDETFEDLYIPCARGRIQATCTPYILFWYTDSIGKGRNLKREIDDKYGKKLEYTYEETDGDVMIYFDEKNFKKVATLVKPRTSGANIKPFSSANLPKGSFKLPDEAAARFTEVYKDLARDEKMHFAKAVIKDFDEVIQKKKGKKVLAARKESGLTPKEYIYQIGLWDDFIKFAKKQYDAR